MNIFSRKFKRTKENFVCEHCGFSVAGTGYTNHCPKCLWSKHVDINPGDRLATCQGMMAPVAVELKHGDYVVWQRCQKCGFEKRNKIDRQDDFEAVVKLADFREDK